MLRKLLAALKMSLCGLMVRPEEVAVVAENGDDDGDDDDDVGAKENIACYLNSI